MSADKQADFRYQNITIRKRRFQYLYHGTSAAAVPSILEHGVHPRQTSGAEPISQIVEFQGYPDWVYLSNAYASYFAAEAVGSDGGFTGEAAILEIDTDLLNEELILEDELVTEWLLLDNRRYAYIPREELIAMARDRMSHDWLNSLELMGTCAYRGIVPPSAIKRVCYIDFANMPPHMLFDITDMTLSVEAFKMSGVKYRMLDAWFWGGEVELGFGLLSRQQQNQRSKARARKEFREMWSDRSMVRIEECLSREDL